MAASSGVRSRLRALHDLQHATTFSQLVGPPRLRGMTWSRVRSDVCVPQYWQLCSSRLNTFLLLNATRCLKGARTKRFSLMTLGTLKTLLGERSTLPESSTFSATSCINSDTARLTEQTCNGS